MTTPFRTFIGDGERDLILTPALILELERLTGTGIAALCRRVFGREWHLADLQEAIRLGLIGGGASPEEAATITKLYVAERPLTEILPPALGVLSAAWFGPDQEGADA